MMQREGRYPLWLASILANNTGPHRRCWHLVVPAGFVSTDLKTGSTAANGVACGAVLRWVGWFDLGLVHSSAESLHQ